MPRIRQYADRDALKDFISEINAQCARLDMSTNDLGAILGITGRTVLNHRNDPDKIQIGMLREMVKTLKLNPDIVLRALGYTTKDIKKLAKEYTK